MGAPAPAELELGRKRRGGSSSSSSSITQELLLGVTGGLPPALAALVEQLLAEGDEAAALSVAVAALSRLRSRAVHRDRNRRSASIPDEQRPATAARS